jgi:hypothetical protein
MNTNTIGLIFALIGTPAAAADQSTELLFGDTHLHTSYSFDAFLNKNQTADPDTAYRWARGLPVIHPYNRARVQIQTPLDFLVVSDHAELMGVMRAVYTNEAEFEDLGWWANLKRWLSNKAMNYAVKTGNGNTVFGEILPSGEQQIGVGPNRDPVRDPANIFPDNPLGNTLKIETHAWSDIVEAAERHNAPGEFTSLIGWEWSSIPVGANLHRIVITPDGADKAKQFVPFDSEQSQYPEDLWQWLEETEQRTGARFMAIPHNSNISKGYMYAETTLRGEPISAEYATRRMSWEPISEATQIKGDSETHPSVSPDDEFADFETYTHYIQQDAQEYAPAAGDFIRSGLKRGLALEQRVGVNPYQFGLIGSTDSHSGLASAEEDNFWGKFARDSTPETKRSEDTIGGNRTTGWDMSASGLAAVWARENTREEIFAAMQRKEVYATTGTRLKVRVFAGWEFTPEHANSQNLADIGYELGVPMGGNLTRNPNPSGAPKLMIRAFKDPKDANLDRIQVVKGWIDSSGLQRERVFNAAWSGERELDSQGKLSAVGNTVDTATASYDNSIGAAELSVLWSDPEFNLEQSAFYYVRVLQIPTPRHSLYDGVALQIDIPQEGPASIQERAYTSPIWYTP